MNIQLLTDLALEIRALEKVVSGTTVLLNGFDEQKKQVEGDPTRSHAWKEEQTSKIEKCRALALRTMRTEVEPKIEYLASLPIVLHDAFDFADETFQHALNTIQTLGKALPASACSDIVERFRFNPDALDILQQLFNRHHFDTEALKEYKRFFSEQTAENIRNDLSRVCFFAYPASTSAEMQLMKGLDVNIKPRFEKELLEGVLQKIKIMYQIKTDENPYLLLIREMMEKSTDERQIARIQNFLEIYENDLKADDPDAMQQAKRRIEKQFLLT